MKRLAALWLFTLLPCSVDVVQAQAVEVGGGISAGCRGSEGGLCGDERFTAAGAYTSLWVADRIELGGRVARGPLPDLRIITPRDGTFRPEAGVITVSEEDRSISYLTGQAIYHFRRGHRVRPMLGLGAGVVRIARTLRCTPADCAAYLQLIAGSSDLSNHVDAVVISGVSIRATERVTVRVGWQAHNFGGEELSSVEWVAAAGWRFGGLP
jgi:hypothetical protein